MQMSEMYCKNDFFIYQASCHNKRNAIKIVAVNIKIAIKEQGVKNVNIWVYIYLLLPHNKKYKINVQK